VDSAYATNFFTVGSEQTYYTKVRLIKASVVQSTNKASTPVNILTSNPAVFGGSTDLWGGSWVGSDFDDPNFGIVISFGSQDSPSPMNVDRSGDLTLTGFTFGLSNSVTILGIETSINALMVSSGGGTQTLSVDGVSIRIYYTYTPKINAIGDSAAVVYSAVLHPTMPDKTFDYNVSDHSGNYIGKLPEPGSDPIFKRDINNVLSSMQLTLPINDTTSYPAQIGPGQIVELNNEVEVNAYYGDYEPTVDENGEPMGDEDFNIQFGTNGAPEGDTIFTGFLDVWEQDIGTNETTLVTLMSHSNELFNIMLETDDTLSVDNSSWNGGDVGIAGSGPGDNIGLAQVISIPSSSNFSKVTMPLKTYGSPVVSGQVYFGTPASVGGFIVNVQGVVGDDLGGGWFMYTFSFGSYISLVSGATITIYFSSSIFKTGGSPTYPANWKTGNGYSGHAWVDSGSGFVEQIYSVLFTLWIAGGSTDVSYINIDPANILKKMIDFAAARGSRVRYTDDSITPTFTNVNVPFKGALVGEAVQSIPALCPADWYLIYDFGTNIVYLKHRPGAPDRIVTLGQNLASLKIGRRLTGIVNQTFFTGGGSPSLYLKTTDQDARIKWRPGLEKMNNINVVDQASARIISQNEIDRKKEPGYYGTLTIFSKGYWIEDVDVGELMGFMNHGELIDALDLQAASITYYPDKLDIPLQTLPIQTTRLADDTKRQVNNLAAINNPSSPS
jgi:hypothetical protein